MNKIKLQVGVKALLKNLEGKYLLLHRNMNLYSGASAPWDIAGGRIIFGESLLKNLAREINEETGLELIEKPKLVAAQDILRKQGYYIVRLTYVGNINGIPRLNKEHDKYGFFELSELKTMPKNELDNYFKELLDEGLFD